MKNIPGALLILALLPLPAWSQEPQTNYCHDPHVIADWDERVTRRPDDIPLQTLHALWLGLCLKVERGELSINTAIDIFDDARNSMIRDLEKQREQHDHTDQSAATS